MQMKDYKACILAAGIGSRMEVFTKHFNKAMLPIQGKPVISHIIEKFPDDVEIVIALGYMGDSLKEYVRTAYPNKRLSFVEKYTGQGKGPGYRLLQCREHLSSPFIFSAADTLVLEDIPEPKVNWFGLAKVLNIERFCSAKISNRKVIKIEDKVKTDSEFAFVGLAGIKDHEIFLNALESNKNIIGEEIQVSNGLVSLVERDLHAEFFTWFDVGTPTSYTHAIKNYPFGSPYRGE